MNSIEISKHTTYSQWVRCPLNACHKCFSSVSCVQENECWLAVSPHLRAGWVGFLLHAGSGLPCICIHPHLYAPGCRSLSLSHTRAKGQVWKERSVLTSPAFSRWNSTGECRYCSAAAPGTLVGKQQWIGQMSRWTCVWAHSSNLFQVYSVFVLPSLLIKRWWLFNSYGGVRVHFFDLKCSLQILTYQAVGRLRGLHWPHVAKPKYCMAFP